MSVIREIVFAPCVCTQIPFIKHLVCSTVLSALHLLSIILKLPIYGVDVIIPI